MIFRAARTFRLPWRPGFGRVGSFDEVRWTRTPPAKTEQGVGCNPAERVNPCRFAEPRPHRSQVMCRGRLHPHQRSVRNMDPYETPKTQSSEPTLEAGKINGRRCPKCGSTNTMRDFVLRPKPSILMVIFFGWIFLLIRGAFAMRIDECRDCGASNRYKSVGSWIAMAVLIFLVICVTAAVLAEGHQS